MTREKAQRGDQQLDRREQRGDQESTPEEALSDRASRIWRRIEDATRPDVSGEIDTTARAGLRDPAHELPFRSELEAQVGTDLSGVQAHSGPNASAASTQLGAEAYTVDGAIVLGTAQPSKDLVAHELVHVLQAGTGGASSRESDEAEATAAGDRMAAGERIDPSRLVGGARGVRKREKSPTQALADLVAMMGDVDFSEREGELHVSDRKDTSHDDSVEGQRTSTTTKDTIDTRKGLAISSEETVTTGAFVAPRTEEQAAAERERVKNKLDEAKLDLTIEVMVATGKAMALQMRATQMDTEASRLEAFEPALVEGKREQLKRDAAAARATAQAIVKETEARQKLIEELEQERAGIDDRDAWRIASDLAKAELAFRQTTKVTKKHSLGFNALKGELAVERGIAETRTDEGGSTTNSRGSKSTGKIGKGAHLSHTETGGTKIEDADGNLVRDEQTSATAKAGVALGKDGSVGVDGGAKLTKAIETSHGKATTSVAFDGSVTVNIVALPRATPDAEQKYSVVVTMNLAAALAFGLSKTGKHKQGKGTAGVDLGASASGELTHTHILDAERAADYLASLEQAGNGDKAAAKRAPEFGLLFKALQGVSSIDDIADSVTATVGSAEAASGLGVDESIELTLKAGGSIDVALGAEREQDKASAGVSGGASTEAFRTLKVARVAGKPGQQLVEVTVMFGDKSDLHGALTGAALGVSVSAGKKQWSGAEQAVTFRLDAQLGDYEDLYQTIVGTTSRSELAELRKGARFRAHVQAYSDKAETGGEETFGISGKLGVATKDSWTRTSTSGKEDGEEFFTESGSSTGEVGFSVGPLELLRRKQTASATFDTRGGVSTLDVSQQTDDATATTFEAPSWQEFLAADSPLAALQKAVTENRRRLVGFLLDPHDLRALANRAKRTELWSKVPLESKASDGGFNEDDARDWRILGAELVEPTLDDSFGVEHIELAREVARGRAVADCMASIGKGKGLQYLDVVLRNYDKVGGDATDLGVSYEFPKGITPASYLDLRFELRDVDNQLGTMAVDETGVHPGIEHCTDLEVRTAKMLDKLEQATFESERARVEMMHELRERVAVVYARRSALERGDTGAPLGNTPTVIYHREMSLLASKRAERTLLARCEHIMADDDLFASEISDALEPIMGLGGQLEELYENHVRMIVALRATYRAAEIPEAEWVCSVDVNDESRELDVDFDRALDALWAYHENKPLDLGIASYDDRKQTWNRKYWSY